MRNLLLTLLVLIMLFCMTLAIPAGDLSEQTMERYSVEETDDEFDFL
jgi:hypothetical protein